MVKSLLFSFLLLIGFSAHAGLMIEPYVGYMTGDFKYKGISSSTEFTDTTSGTAFGARLGYKFLLPWIALDYTTGSGTRKVDTSSSITDQDYSVTGIGATVGADLPLGLRVFGGYGTSNTLTFKGKNGNADSKLKGSYTKVGLGYKFIPLIAMNAEYIMNKYTKYDNGTTEVDADSSFSSLDHNMIFVSLSVPFSL